MQCVAPPDLKSGINAAAVTDHKPFTDRERVPSSSNGSLITSPRQNSVSFTQRYRDGDIMRAFHVSEAKLSAGPHNTNIFLQFGLK